MSDSIKNTCERHAPVPIIGYGVNLNAIATGRRSYRFCRMTNPSSEARPRADSLV